jgi:hypothetical protein
MSKKIHALDTISGKVGLVPEAYLNLPVFKDHLVRVEEDQKDYEPEMHKPTSANEFNGRKNGKKVVAEEEPVLEDTQPLDYDLTLDSEVQ